MNQMKSKYPFIIELQKGNYGKVLIILDKIYLSKKEKSFEFFQVEQINDNDLTQQIKDELKMEIFLINKVQHKNFMTFIEYYTEQGFQYLVLKFQNGLSLKEHLEKNTKFPEEVAKIILKQMLEAMQELSKHKIIYYPFKLENIILLDGGLIKLTNLGGCLKLNVPIPIINDSIVPEIIEKKNNLLESNIFQAGYIFYQLLYGVPPYKLNSRSGIQIKLYLSSIKDNPLKFDESLQISDYSKDLLQQMLQYSPQQRITLSKALESLEFKESEKQPINPVQTQNIESFNAEESIDLNIIIANYQQELKKQIPIQLQKYNELREVIQFYINTASEMNIAKQLDLCHIQFLLFFKVLLELEKLQNELKINDQEDFKEFNQMVQDFLPIINYQIDEIKGRMDFWSADQKAIVSDIKSLETINKKFYDSIMSDFKSQKIQIFFRVHNHIIDCYILRDLNVNQMHNNWQNDFGEETALIPIDRQLIIQRLANIKM